MQFNFKRFLVFFLTGYLLFSAPQLINYFVLPASASISQPEVVRVSDRQIHLRIPPEVMRQWRKFAKIHNHKDRHQITQEKPTILLA